MSPARPRRLQFENPERRELMATSPVTVVENTTFEQIPLGSVNAPFGTQPKTSPAQDSLMIRCGEWNNRVEVHGLFQDQSFVDLSSI